MVIVGASFAGAACAIAAAQRGLRIPHDLSVVGFDNQELIADGLVAVAHGENPRLIEQRLSAYLV